MEKVILSEIAQNNIFLISCFVVTLQSFSRNDLKMENRSAICCQEMFLMETGKCSLTHFCIIFQQ